MTLKPYNTRTSIIREARRQGHVVLTENNAVTIDTGEELLTINETDVTDRAGKSVTLDAAMDTVKAKPQD